jgi:dienelactone hydrolase
MHPDKVIDQGTFALTVAGKRVGQESFQVSEQGEERVIRTSAQLTDARGAALLRGTLRLDDRWRPRSGRFEWVSRGGKRRMTLTRKGELPELAVENGARQIVYTRPEHPSDFFALSSPPLLSHLYPLCRLAEARPRTLTAFPAAPMKLSALVRRPFPQTRVGAPAVELATVVVDLAQSTRYELVCDGPRLVALRQAGRALIATRASYEAVGSALEALSRSKPPLPQTLKETAVRVPALGAVLSCALVTPPSPDEARPRTAPALLLLHDAGLHDRDGDPVGPGDPKLSLLKRLAIRLGEAGIASIRCDDRGAGGPPDRAPRPSLDGLAADARAVLAVLRRRPDIDGARIGVIGHGEGGLVAALASRDQKLASVALLGTAGRPLDAVVLADTEATLRRFGYPEPEIQSAVAEQKALYDAVRAGKPLPKTLSTAERQAVGKALPWMRSHLQRDPAAVVGEMQVPAVLVAQGGKDSHLASTDLDRLRAAAEKSGKIHVTAKLYPDLNRPFATAASGSLIDYLDPRADLSEAFLADVVLFERRALTGGPPVAQAPARP